MLAMDPLLILGCSVLLFLTATSARSLAWQERREELIAQHPLYGRLIKREDLPTFSQLALAARALPIDDQSNVYLIQGEEDTAAKQAAMWSDVSDVFVLTFRTRRRDALFFPNSLLAEGRNALLGAAAHQELWRGRRYAYYVFLDADAEAVPPWPQSILRFEAFLMDWRPAVGLPALASSLDQDGLDTDKNDAPKAIFHFDHIFVAVHTDAALALLPYDTTFDHSCAWVSQWTVSLLATAFFRRHVLLLPAVHVLNPRHAKYPKDRCIADMTNASARLRAAVPARANCFPDPALGLVMLSTGVSRFAYLSLGAAQQKGDVNYSRATLASIQPCDGEIFTEVATHELDSPICHGCTMPLTLLTLQAATAAMPLSERNWNALGAWFCRVAPLEHEWGAQVEAFVMAAICFAVAGRLMRIAGQAPSSVLAGNVAEVNRLLTTAGFEKPVDSAEFWADGGARAQQAIRTVFTVADWKAAGLEDPWLMSQASLSSFVEFLIAA